jgi:hypothetical protein
MVKNQDKNLMNLPLRRSMKILSVKKPLFSFESESKL